MNDTGSGTDTSSRQSGRPMTTKAVVVWQQIRLSS